MSGENKIYLQDKSVVAPGDLIAEGNFQIPWSPYIVKQGNKYFASVIGIVEVKDSVFEIIPLEGSHYYPRIGDTVIALVEDVELTVGSPTLKLLIRHIYQLHLCLVDLQM